MYMDSDISFCYTELRYPTKVQQIKIIRGEGLVIRDKKV